MGTSTVNVVEFNPIDYLLLSGSDDCTCSLLDIRGNQVLQRFRNQDCAINCASYLPRNKGAFVCGSQTGRLSCWMLGDDNESVSLQQEYNSSISSLAWHPLGLMLASGTRNTGVKLWMRDTSSSS